MPQQLRAFPAPTFSRQTAPAGSSTATDRWALTRVQRAVPSARVRLALWDGFDIQPARGAPVATVVFKTRRALLATIWNPDLNLGDAYMRGDVEVQGDLVAMLSDVYRALERRRPRPWWLGTRSNGLREARENVHRHYDLGNDFYRLWLDREMVYTCGYFPTPQDTLEAAQIAKMDLVCRKLALMPGDRVVEAGCGWGSLAIFMARHYGVHVRAFNVSAEQIAFARQRAREESVADRVDFVEDDYRNVRGEYDAFVSVGMLEHVGSAHYRTLGSVIARSLTQRGRGLLHFIGRSQPGELNPWIRKRIFPGAHIPTLPEVFKDVLEPPNLAALDVENLRLHYEVTLDHWRRRFESALDDVANRFDEPFVRAWRLYLAGSQAAFATGSLHLFQIVFARGSSNAIPWTRAT
jgi:cyclopropane-fatty-acyl-phospholipid synthase